jgi:outer membrane protein
MKTSGILVLSGCLCLAACGGETQSATRVLGMSDSIRIGLDASEAMLNAYRDRAIALLRKQQAGAEASPQVSLAASYTRLDEVESFLFGEETVRLGTLDNYAVSARIDQLLYSGGRVRAALRAARALEDLAAWELDETRQALVRDIRLRFLDVLLARHVVHVREQSVEQLEALVLQTRQKYDRDAASEFDVLSAQVKLANEQPPLIRARNDHELAREAFRRLVNLGDAPFRIEGVLDFQPDHERLDTFLAEALASRPVLRIVQAQVRLLDEDVVAARSGLLPDIRTHFAYSGANAYEFAGFDDEWRWHWNAGLRLSWDLWDGGRTRRLVGEKRLERDKRQTDLDALRKTVALQVRRAYLAREHARQSVEASRDNVALAEKALDIAAVRYGNGLATRLEYTDANLSLNTARLALYGALRDHAAAGAELDYACGRAVHVVEKGAEQ